MTSIDEASRADALWVPKRQMTLEQARKRSDVVKLLRMIFTAGAAISLGVLLGYLASNAVINARRGADALRSEDVVTMINPRFIGRDAEGDLFEITADRAQRHLADENLVDLVSPKLIDSLDSEVRASKGIYDRDAQVLELTENVRVVDASGYVFTTTHARVFIRDNRVEGIEPLQGSGPVGDVRANSYEILDGGQRTVLTGNVRSILYPEGRPDEARSGAE